MHGLSILERENCEFADVGVFYCLLPNNLSFDDVGMDGILNLMNLSIINFSNKAIFHNMCGNKLEKSEGDESEESTFTWMLYELFLAMQAQVMVVD